jgi:hypothetical protein
MTDSDPERPTGSHRRSNQPARLRLLVGSLALVVVAALGVTWALHWRGEGSRLPRPAAASRTSHPRTSASSSTSGSGSNSASTSAASSPAASSSPPTLIFTKPKPTPTPTPTSTPKPTLTPVVRPPVDVLNDSRIVGLAARAAKTLKAAGWDVEKTGNYAHVLGSTTLYYPAGQRAAAQLLASQFPKIAEVLPAPQGLSATDLTLVLTRGWSSSGG